MSASTSRLRASDWSSRLAWWLDLLSLGALAGTFEVRTEVMILVAASLALSQVARRLVWTRGGLGERPLLALLASVIAASVARAWGGGAHPIEVAAQAAPVAHALVWFAPDTLRYRGWRLGMGFIELVLASALTTELYLPAAIFLFVILSSVAVSCSFLASQLELRAPERAGEALPPAFVRDSLAVAFLIFLTSAVIFPILPRRSADLDLGLGLGRLGYTEEVNLASPERGFDASAGQALLRLYPPADTGLATEIYLGLLRGAVLDQYDGTLWRAARKKKQEPVLPSNDPLPGGRWIEAVREPIGSDVLPVPYGVTRLDAVGGAGDGLSLLSSGEWLAWRSKRRRVAYRFPLPTRFGLAETREDRPLAMHRELPTQAGQSDSKSRIARLARRIFGDASDERSKIARLRAHFVAEGFKATYDLPGAAPAGLNPTERFLFVDKAGRCEHFASASALLLRHAGVATRLVSGFRLTRTGAVGVPLTLRSGDAHAWIEAWIPGQGWVALDLTPRILTPDSLTAWFLDGYDRLSAYWYRYVVTYDEQAQNELGAETMRTWARGSGENLGQWSARVRRALANRLDLVALALAGLLAVGGAWIAASRLLSRPRWLSRRRLRQARERRDWIRARIRMGRWLARRLGVAADDDLRSALEPARVRWGAEGAERLARWLELYERGRFGRAPTSLAQLRQEESGIRRGVRHLFVSTVRQKGPKTGPL